MKLFRKREGIPLKIWKKKQKKKTVDKPFYWFSSILGWILYNNATNPWFPDDFRAKFHNVFVWLSTKNPSVICMACVFMHKRYNDFLYYIHMFSKCSLRRVLLFRIVRWLKKDPLFLIFCFTCKCPLLHSSYWVFSRERYVSEHYRSWCTIGQTKTYFNKYFLPAKHCLLIQLDKYPTVFILIK